MVGTFPDGRSSLMLVTARHKYVAAAPHSTSAAYFRRAVTSMSSSAVPPFPFGSVPTKRVRLRITRLILSMALLVRILLQWVLGKRVCARVSA